MTDYSKHPIYIQNFIQDLQLRNRKPKTIHGYVYGLLRLTRKLGKKPDKITLKEVKSYLQEMIAHSDYSFNTYKQNVCAIRYYYKNVSNKKWTIDNIPYPKREITPTVMLSKSEVIRLFLMIKCPKVKMMAIIAYACGLRHSEVRHLQISSLDVERNKIIIKNGKGKKFREVQLPKEVLLRLREYYKLNSESITPYFFWLGERAAS